MKLTNEEIIRKVITAAESLASGGKLNPEQADTIYDSIVDQSVLKGSVRIVQVRSETWELHKLNIGKRILIPADEAKDPALRRGVTGSKITMTPREFKAPLEISDIAKEVNIEGEKFVDHVLQIIGRAVANDMELLGLNGDILGAAVLQGDIIDGGSGTQYVVDPLLAKMDGWLKLADGGHPYAAAGANIGAAVFSEAFQQMPTKWRTRKADMRWLIGSDLLQKWAEKKAGRVGPLGDEALTTGGARPVFGINFFEVPLLDLQPKVVKHVTLPGTTATSLGYTHIKSLSEVVTATTLAKVPVTKMIKDTDYTMDYTAGTIARKVGGAIGDGDTVKVTFQTGGVMVLTHLNNLILGIGRDIRVEKGRDIFSGTDQFVMSLKIGLAVEDADAIVKVINLGTSV